MLLPSGAGSWPSFWLLDQHGIQNSNVDGAVEIDVIEGYGHSLTSYVATQHDWPSPSANGIGYKRAQRNITGLPDGSLVFHDYGVEVTEDTSSSTTTASRSSGRRSIARTPSRPSLSCLPWR